VVGFGEVGNDLVCGGHYFLSIDLDWGINQRFKVLAKLFVALGDVGSSNRHINL